tara:strand:+ start:1373 stop:1678 length:306 start_codon:yes stop_codon:yes gene_type:complete
MPEEQEAQTRNAPSEYTRTVNGDVRLDVLNCFVHDIDAGEVTLTRAGKEITRPAKWCVRTTNLDNIMQQNNVYSCNTKQEAITHLLQLESALKAMVTDEEE